MTEWWRYQSLAEDRERIVRQLDWSPAERGDRPWDQCDFHLDLGCGRVPKARMGIDLRESRGATDLEIDLNTLLPVNHRTSNFYGGYAKGWPENGGCLPFPDASIKSIVTHHAFEHIGDGFERLMEECYRVLEWGGIMRIVVPLFPSRSAVQEYDHKRYFMEGTFLGFCNHPSGTCSTDGYSEPYNTCAFKLVDEDMTPPTPVEDMWGKDDYREVRATLWKWRGDEPSDPDPGDYR